MLSVGCTKQRYEQSQGFRYGGYIELAFNSIEWIEDANHYFPLFFHFDQYLNETRFDVAVGISWSLGNVVFIDYDAAGFSATIGIDTPFVESEYAAGLDW